MWGDGVVLKLEVALGALVEVPAGLALEGLGLKGLPGLMLAVLSVVEMEVLEGPGREMVPGRDRVVFVLPALPRW